MIEKLHALRPIPKLVMRSRECFLMLFPIEAKKAFSGRRLSQRKALRAEPKIRSLHLAFDC